jgi:hypothetical protein
MRSLLRTGRFVAVHVSAMLPSTNLTGCGGGSPGGDGGGGSFHGGGGGSGLNVTMKVAAVTGRCRVMVTGGSPSLVLAGSSHARTPSDGLVVLAGEGRQGSTRLIQATSLQFLRERGEGRNQQRTVIQNRSADVVVEDAIVRLPDRINRRRRQRRGRA